jgi:peptidoglycan hydrolase-like protein with peptidoglycan-binding domain
MKLLHYGVTIGLLAGLGACSDMMGNGGGSAPRAAATQPVVAPDMVRQVQTKLRDGGYYKQGPVDGVWGSGTENAVRSFQHDHNLASSGQLDVPTLQALNLASGASAADNTNPPATQPMNSNVPPAALMTPNPNARADTHPDARADTTTSPPR